MLRITIPAIESFDESSNEFVDVEPEVAIDLEHSLISLSKWESKHQKPFLSPGKKTSDEIFDYLKGMLLDPEMDPDVVYRCSQVNIDEIQAYIDSSQSATTFGPMTQRRGPSETITSELIYFWMTSFQIDWQAQHWHLNRLFALIRIHNAKNAPKKKMTKHETAQRNRELNAQRLAQYNTSG